MGVRPYSTLVLLGGLRPLVGEVIELEVSAGSLDDGWEPLLVLVGIFSMTSIGPVRNGQIEMLVGGNPAYLDPWAPRGHP